MKKTIPIGLYLSFCSTKLALSDFSSRHLKKLTYLTNDKEFTIHDHTNEENAVGTPEMLETYTVVLSERK